MRCGYNHWSSRVRGRPWWHSNKYTCQCRRLRFSSWVGKIPWRKWQTAAVFWPGKSHGRRRLAGYSPRGCKGSDTTERPRAHTEKVKGTRLISPVVVILSTFYLSPLPTLTPNSGNALSKSIKTFTFFNPVILFGEEDWKK